MEQEMVEKNIFPEKTVKMKQLELDFVKILRGPEQKLQDDVNCDEDAKQTTATVAKASAEAKEVVVVAQKQNRKMTIKQLAKKNAKMTGWLVKPGKVPPIQNLMEQEVEAMELDCPELEDPE